MILNKKISLFTIWIFYFCISLAFADEKIEGVFLIDDIDSEDDVEETGSVVSNEGRCGEGFGSCDDNECCSKYGWCGRTSDYCSIARGCQSAFGRCDEEKPSKDEKSYDEIIIIDNDNESEKEGDNAEETDIAIESEEEDDDSLYKCGGKYGNCRPGECCSKYGWCGKTDAYCSIAKGCQSEFGECHNTETSDGQKHHHHVKIKTVIVTKIVTTPKTRIPSRSNH